MDAGHPKAAGAAVPKFVGHLARADYHLSTMGQERFIADREGRLTIVQNENLVVRMAMQPRPFAGRCVHHEERHGHAAVVGPFE